MKAKFEKLTEDELRKISGGEQSVSYKLVWVNGEWKRVIV